MPATGSPPLSMRRLLPWATGISLALLFIAPAEVALLLTLYSYPALSAWCFSRLLPVVVGRTQDLFARILIGLGVAVASGIGAGLLILLTCLGRFTLRDGFR